MGFPVTGDVCAIVLGLNLDPTFSYSFETTLEDGLRLLPCTGKALFMGHEKTDIPRLAEQQGIEKTQAQELNVFGTDSQDWPQIGLFLERGAELLGMDEKNLLP